MRIAFITLFVLPTFLYPACPSPVLATEPAAEELPPPEGDTIIVYRRTYVNEPLADLGARLHDKIDYARTLRRLETDIQLAESVLEVQRERVRVYTRDFGRTPALFVTRQNARLDVLATELRLKELRREKLLLLRYRPEVARFRKLVIEAGDLQLPLPE